MRPPRKVTLRSSRGSEKWQPYPGTAVDSALRASASARADAELLQAEDVRPVQRLDDRRQVRQAASDVLDVPGNDLHARRRLPD